MSVTPAASLAGLLPVVPTGGRPLLKERSTRRLLAGLEGVTAAPVWVMLDEHAPGYERDGHEVVTYPREWAEEHAAGHWIAEKPFRPGAFLGAFCGREWACRVAAERGYWGVMQLDDNIERITVYHNYGSAARVVKNRGGLGWFADILAAVTLSTNSRMTGAALSAVDPSAEAGTLARAGFPYSLFIEQLGPGREPWVGPTEDDIMHAWAYASAASSDTASVVLPLRYKKRHRPADGTGMRGYYTDQSRAVGLQRMAPEMAKLIIKTKYANGLGKPRVFHHMKAGAISGQTPLVVTDPGLYAAMAAEVKNITEELAAEFRKDVAVKLAKRARRAGVTTSGGE